MKVLCFWVLAIWLAGVHGRTETVSTTYPCPFLGAAYAKPIDLNKDSTVKEATDNITETLKLGLTTGLLDNRTTAFSITVFSAFDEENQPFYTFHHTPPSLETIPVGVKQITSDSVYRLGSVSKLYTIYSLLVADGFKHFYSPITDFVPELLNDADGGSASVEWGEITLQSLASHLGGIGAECTP